MIRKIIALCLVLMMATFTLTGCKDDTEPTKPETDKIEEKVDDAGDAAKKVVDEHAGHNHD